MNDTLDNWRRRRRVIYLSLIFIAGMLVYLAGFAVNDALHQQLAVGLVGAGMAIVIAYVFGAAWDDKNKIIAGLSTNKGGT